MTIKVCHKSFDERIDSFYEGLTKVGQWLHRFVLIGFPILFVIGIIIIYHLPYPHYDYTGIYMVTVFTGIFGMLANIFHLTLRWDDDPTIYEQINNKLKLFAWDEDC